MKKIPLIIIISLLLFSCSGKTTYIVRRPSETETPVKPTQKTGSYVINGKKYYPITDSSGFIQVGEASWYGKKFHGRKTANGETYDMHKKSAAHKILPFDTVVKVENLSNGKYTIVRINDRGPFMKGRIIDLSLAAAKEIDLVGPGVARVRITALKNKEEKQEIRKGEFTIQIGSFSERENAEKLAGKLRVIYDYVKINEYINEKNQKFFRLHVTKTGTLNDAGRMEKQLEDLGFEEAFIVRL